MNYLGINRILGKKKGPEGPFASVQPTKTLARLLMTEDIRPISLNCSTV